MNKDQAFEKWWNETDFGFKLEGTPCEKYAAQLAWDLQQARIDKLEEALRFIDNLHDDDELKDWDNTDLLNLAMNTAFSALQVGISEALKEKTK